MAAVLVSQFHARDAEGRIYPVHEYEERVQRVNDADEQVVISYRLAHGDRVNWIADNHFVLAQSGIELTRVP